jgi:4-amino-4-deoxy-L-arabinose transferase-like glycosyltransferase
MKLFKKPEKFLQTFPHHKTWFALLLLCWVVTFVGSNRTAVSPVDASIRASMARHVVQTGILYPPYFENEVMVDHPPLYIWSIAAAFKVFGVNDFAAVFPGRLAAAITILLVFLTALRAGLSHEFSLLAALILAATRDFIIISVQGGIEPLFAAFTTAAFLLVLPSRRPYWTAFAAGVCVVGAAFAKGPPALWPLLFLPFVILVQKERRTFRLVLFAAGVAFCALIWYAWIKKSHLEWYWLRYWKEQVLGSAIEGRASKQKLDVFYFGRILLLQYWPWLPFLFWCIYVAVRRKVTLLRLTLLYGLGFFGGFSLVKWKYWYYIAPAFPAFALAIAATVQLHVHRWKKVEKFFAKERLSLWLRLVLIPALFILSVFPVNLDGNFMPEIRQFSEAIRHSDAKGPVWFVAHGGDHNMYSSSGFWYFDRVVKKVDDPAKFVLPGNTRSWILTSSANADACKFTWCRNVDFAMKSGPSAFLLVRP